MRKRAALITALICVAASLAQAQSVTQYKQPSPDIVAMLDAPALPQAQASPDGRWMLLMERPAMPSITDMAQAMLRLAGTRISPQTNGTFQSMGVNKLTLIDLSTKASRAISLPPDPKLSSITWSPDNRRIAFVQRLGDRLELWVADVASGKSTRVSTAQLNATTGNPYEWLPDSSGFIAMTVPKGRGPEPKPEETPSGPKVQETTGGRAPTVTYQDLLQDAHDEALFKHYFTSQLARIDIASAKVTMIGTPAIFNDANLSPDGQLIYVARIIAPYSYFVPYGSFGQELEVWDQRGTLVRKIATIPLAEKTPIGGVRTGPRNARWQPNAPATLVYAEALDEGDPKRKVPHRDRVTALDLKSGQSRELFKTEMRFGGADWTERGDIVIYREMDRPTRKARTHFIGADGKSRVVFDLSTEDRYRNPGNFVSKRNQAGQQVTLVSADGQHLYLTGQGATPQGERPFLRRLNIATLQTEDLFRAEDPYYESVIAVLDANGQRILTTRESVSEAPNIYLRDLSRKDIQALTQNKDPQPAFRKVKKELVTYKRADGITLSGTLYLPPDYKQGERRPTFIWAYPVEFASADAASQIAGSPNRFTRVGGASHLFLVLQGYVVLDNAAMPILGGEKANDTYVEQLVQNAQAAVKFLDEKGVTDKERIGVGGHSYGAFMTANLLAHSDLFRAGIARSGAYNRTLTPFSFQNERRTFWEAAELYMRMSPFTHADKINEPILLIHGEADNNTGTFPIQSERLFHALRGLGKTARYVTLPLESHGYAARESVLHTVYEMLNWMDRHVKKATPPSQAARQ